MTHNCAVMKLTIIIPCLNNAKTIGAQLEALGSQHCSAPWEIIVSDNGSTDKSMEIAKRYTERLTNLRVIDSSDQQGVSHARNVGAMAATGDYLLFCDADDVVAPDWVSAFCAALSKYDFVACRAETKTLSPEWADGLFNRHAQENALQTAWYPPYLPYAAGGTLGIKKTLHEAVGGFDESCLTLEGVNEYRQDYKTINLVYKSLHNEPRFQNLLRRMNFPEEVIAKYLNETP